MGKEKYIVVAEKYLLIILTIAIITKVKLTSINNNNLRDQEVILNNSILRQQKINLIEQ